MDKLRGPFMPTPRKFHRSSDDRLFAGVCGGLGEYFDIDPNLVRVAAVAGAILTAVVPFLLVYLAMWLMFPDRAGGRPLF